MSEVTMEKIVSLCKRRGFIFPSSEIYGGINSCYDYGPLGVELKNNVKKAWYKAMVQMREDIVGLDASIIMHPRVWEASGHVDGFTDPLVECKKTKKRYRADKLLEEQGIDADGLPLEKIAALIKEHNITSPDGGELSEPRNFNLLMETQLGALEGTGQKVYLRGETCQGIYVNFANVRETMRKKLPFGIAQIGKAFRNEITPGNFVFRMREFEQMEMQYFVHPEAAQKHMEFWKEHRMNWYLGLGMTPENLRFHQHGEDQRAHYAVDAWDIEYNTPFGGWKEMCGIHNRGDWDLSRHQEFSTKDLHYFDQVSGEKFIPHVVETSDGADRATLMFLIDAYTEIEGGRGGENGKQEKEVVLRLHKDLAPIKMAILPLSKKEPLQQLAHAINEKLAARYMTMYDETASIGKRYRRQDEIGTPYCITVDFDSLEDNAVTVRDRDTMEQERVAIDELDAYFAAQFK